jgi:AcrR family transcriptional regulator
MFIASGLLKLNGSGSRSRDTRQLILEAAERALRAKGLLGASTREIAREAGVADGTLYVHFSDRIELFLALMQEHLPPFVEPLKRLQHRVGRRTVRANLAEVLDAALTWHECLLPVFGPLAADPQLNHAFRERLLSRNEGPHLAIKAIEAYLVAEQALGRVNPKADPKTAAMLLLSASHFWNSARHGAGNDLGYSRQRLIKDVVNSLAVGLEGVPKERSGRRA